MKYRNYLLVSAITMLLMSSCSPRFICSQGPLQNRLTLLEDRATELSGNLYRGYAIHVQEVFDTEPFTDKDGNVEFLSVVRTIETPVAIDVEAQEEELDYVEDEINAIRDVAEQEFLECLAKEESKRS